MKLRDGVKFCGTPFLSCHALTHESKYHRPQNHGMAELDHRLGAIEAALVRLTEQQQSERRSSRSSYAAPTSERASKPAMSWLLHRPDGADTRKTEPVLHSPKHEPPRTRSPRAELRWDVKTSGPVVAPPPSSRRRLGPPSAAPSAENRSDSPAAATGQPTRSPQSPRSPSRRAPARQLLKAPTLPRSASALLTNKLTSQRNLLRKSGRERQSGRESRRESEERLPRPAAVKRRRASGVPGLMQQLTRNDAARRSEREPEPEDAEPPPTLEDFVSSVVATGAEQQERVENMVRWYMRRRSLVRAYPLLIPGSRLSEAWDWLLSLSILPSLVLYPLVLAFPHDFHPLRPLLLALDGLYWLGILLTFATGVLPSHDEIMIRKPGEIARRYAMSWLLPDLLAAVPYYFVFCGLDGACPSSSSRSFMAPSLTLLCGLRASRIGRSDRARMLLLLPPRGVNEPSHHGGETALIRLCLLFLWLSHAAGCLCERTQRLSNAARTSPPP